MTYAIQKQMLARGAIFPEIMQIDSLILCSWYQEPMQLLCKLKLKINCFNTSVIFLSFQ